MGWNENSKEKEPARYSSRRAYFAWVHMVNRCYKPTHKNFHQYGGRGITVCDRWLESCDAFIADMGETEVGMTLDRVNNSEGYSKNNCRWATRGEQNRNKRCTVLTPEKVEQIHRMRRGGVKYRVIAEALGVNINTVMNCGAGRTWRELAGQLTDGSENTDSGACASSDG